MAVVIDSFQVQHQRVDADLVIGRVDGVVQITCRGALRAHCLQTLRYVLSDLVDGQGNLAVEVEFPDIDVVDLELIEFVGEAAEQSLSHGGRLSVRTRTGQWTSG